jgi:uncharacterized protein YgbK (DUF1537 family)
MQSQHLLKNDVFAALPPEWPHELPPIQRPSIEASGRKVVVLDDDPIGTQTVHGVPVLTEWSVDRLCTELWNDLPAFYVLTNSRSLSLTAAQALNHEIGRNLVAAARQAQRDVVVVSRSDSTLRGHFPGEVTALAAALEQRVDAWLLIPFFADGGRYTIDDVHYVADGEYLVPAAQTPFARDAAFGYRSSNLREWIVEKSGSTIPTAAIASISIEDIRKGGPARVAERLLALEHGSICIVNAANMRDLEVFTHGLLHAEAHGRHFLYRTAASFVPVRAGIEPRPLLSRGELHLTEEGGGLVVVGSYVPTTSAQIAALLAQPSITGVEVNVNALLNDE